MSSLVKYRWTINDPCVFLTSWQQNDWKTRFRSKQYTLPDLCTQSTSLNRILMIQHLRILSFEFFNFVSQFESVDYAVWSTQSLTVKFFSKEHIDKCFDEVVEKGYNATITVIGAIFNMKLRWLNQIQKRSYQILEFLPHESLHTSQWRQERDDAET